MRFLFVIFILIYQSSFSEGFQDPMRVRLLTRNLPLDGVGLEIAPFCRPTLLRNQYNIYYTDYTTAEELIRKHQDLPTAQQIKDHTVHVDFIWTPGKPLYQCCEGKKFDYAISSHVIEHVPNVIGWVSQILTVLRTGGIFSIAAPDKRYCFDAYRAETEVHDLIDLWIRDQHIPSSAQIYDMLSNSCDVPSGSLMPKEEGIPFEDLHRNYTDKEALAFAFHAYATGDYLDIHCSVFTPQSLYRIFLKLVELGILNVFVSEPISCNGEFFIQLTKLGEPSVFAPVK